jgi:hypothetical protein
MAHALEVAQRSANMVEGLLLLLCLHMDLLAVLLCGTHSHTARAHITARITPTAA